MLASIAAARAGKSTLRMAELAALALRALAAGSAPNQDASRGAGAAPLLVALLNPTQNRHMAEERKARKENAAAAAARAILALAEDNEAAKVYPSVCMPDAEARRFRSPFSLGGMASAS